MLKGFPAVKRCDETDDVFQGAIGPLTGKDGQEQDPAAPVNDAELERWARFHEAVDELPAEEREVVSLIFYHGWTQAEVAQCLQMGERTVRRRWELALITLRDRSRAE
jgi:RNA polymerase sigma factor (sigma-70 family)